MKIIQLLEELEEITVNSSKVPLTGKVWVDSEDIKEIVKEIKEELPEEIQRAQWINDERDRLISEAENEASIIIANARSQADALVENNEITNRARERAEEIIANADLQTKNLKLRTYEYIDNVMNSMIERVEYANKVYLTDMYDGLKNSFDQVADMLNDNKTEINNLVYQESVKGKTRDTLDENFLPIKEVEEKTN